MPLLQDRWLVSTALKMNGAQHFRLAKIINWEVFNES